MRFLERTVGHTLIWGIFGLLVFMPGPGFITRASFAAPLYWTHIISGEQLEWFALDVHLPNAWFGI